MRLLLALLVTAVLATSCGAASSTEDASAVADTAGAEDAASTTTAQPEQEEQSVQQEQSEQEADDADRPPVTRPTFGAAPDVPADYDPALTTALDQIFTRESLTSPTFSLDQRDNLATLGASGDPRVAWPLADILRFLRPEEGNSALVAAAEDASGLPLDDFSPWGELVDHLIAWDTPAPPKYLEYKRTLFTLVSESWEPFFDDNAGELVDYRHWSWGGVGIDDRAYNQTDEECNCIPAADNPEVTDAAGGDWYEDDRVVFGVEINGEARAYPRNIMEIREMVNDTLGGRDFAMPYCTLCGSAQVFYTDDVPAGVDRPIMRTSGLLSRSNKVMYDIESQSVFDTFLGVAVTGPLAEKGIELAQAAVVTTTWGEWKETHPDTTILDESLTLGRDSDLLNTRDADGPIFPIGDVDPRLAVQEPVLGVTTESGTPVAFPVAEARSTLLDGDPVKFENVTIELTGGGIRAVDGNGDEIGSHQAFWFAWSQFHDNTEVWGL